MAAESVVRSLVRMMDSLQKKGARDAKFFKQVSKIKKELEMVKDFLKDADARADSDRVVKIWIKQLREAAYDIEDVLDEFEAFQTQKAYDDGNRIRAFFGNAFKIQRLTSQLRKLGSVVVDISARRERYSFKKIEQGSASNAPDNRATDLRSMSQFAQEDELVGIKSPRDELIKWLVEGESRLTTIAVAGMGGLGKTTLAGKVYHSEPVKAHFLHRAWVTVSQSLKLEELFRSMVKEFCGSSIKGKAVDVMETAELIETLEGFLRQRRYVIVLDDLWRTDHWEQIKIGLPHGELGSRIVVTTREIDVATSCSETSHIYNLQPLSPEDGWTLFCKKTFRSEFGGSCPPDLKELSEKIVEKCRGLPLAIVAMGSLLSVKEKTPIEWQKVYESLGYQIASSPSLKAMKKILSLTINDLSYSLKSCFLYLSIFPEDYLIETMRLVRLWIAEKFVEENEGGTLEDVANDYLQELINRSLIQVAERTSYGKVRTCRVHDIVREISLSKSRKWNFLTPFQEEHIKQGDGIRRLSVHRISNSNSKGEAVIGTLLHLRSLLIFSFNSVNNFPFPKSRLLKVLDLEGSRIRSFPNEIVDLLLLRFLSLKKTDIHELPPSIGKLRNLETLDVRYTRVYGLPTSIQELKNLRHLLAFDIGEFPRKGVQWRSEVKCLRSLQSLSYIDAKKGRGGMREVGMLNQLRKLGITNLPFAEGLHLCASLEKMKCLQKLNVSTLKDEYMDLENVSSLPLLQHLRMVGCLNKQLLPCWIPSLSNLIRLELKQSNLNKDPFEDLQHLPNLMILHLEDAYDGSELRCQIGGFQKLRELYLIKLTKLKTLTMMERMLHLQKLRLDYCTSIDELPAGIEHLTHLKELIIYCASLKLLTSLAAEGGRNYQKMSHIPVISIPTNLTTFIPQTEISMLWLSNLRPNYISC